MTNLAKPDSLLADKSKSLNVYEEEIKKTVDEFISSSKNLGEIDNVTNSIKLLDSPVITSKPYSIPLSQYDKFKEKIKDLQNSKIIRKSSSHIVSPFFVIIEKNNDLRLVIDYRKLNTHTIKMAYPIPSLNNQITTLHGCTRFSSIDMNSGYYQIKMNPDDIYKTAFITPFGQYEFLRMPFGLTNAPRTFQMAMNDILGHLSFIRVYLDDVLICSKNDKDHFEHINIVLTIFKQKILQ